jgi:hypothetical protein
MHYAISREAANARIADWRRQAEREAVAAAVTPARPKRPRAARKWIPVGIPGWRLRQPAQEPSR